MGTRIGALWRREKDGHTTITGQIDAPAGICIPAGAKNIGVSIVNNDKHVEGDKLPHFYIELWERNQSQGSGEAF